MKFTFTGQQIDSQTEVLIRALLEGMHDGRLDKNWKQVEICIHPPIEHETAVEQVHKTWSESYFSQVPSPAGAPQMTKGTLCPRGSVLLEVCYINRHSGGMDSYYQFDGYFLSLVVLYDFIQILDARIEKAYCSAVTANDYIYQINSRQQLARWASSLRFFRFGRYLR